MSDDVLSMVTGGSAAAEVWLTIKGPTNVAYNQGARILVER